MDTNILEQLRCPFCLANIGVLKVIEGSEQHIRHGLLNCPDCGFEFPVISGVAIFLGPEDFVDFKAETTAQTLHKGPRIENLVRHLKAGEAVKALSLLLGPAGPKGKLYPKLEIPAASAENRAAPRDFHRPAGREFRPRRGGRILRLANQLCKRVSLPRAQVRLAEFLEKERANLSALDVIDLYYRQFSGVEMFNYFAFRFGQPRHLAGLALGSMFSRTEGPILDLACGVGHLTHFFTQAFPERTVIGLDRDFLRLFVASEYVAPTASYICASADSALPFQDSNFGGIFCSDAFHLFLNRAASVREFDRLLTDDGLLLVCRLGNQAVEPREGYELSLEGYRRLFGNLPYRILGEEDLVSNYLEKRGPNLVTKLENSLAREKWLSVVVSRDEEKFQEPVRFDDWPHATGRLQVNPIYVAEHSGTNGSIDLRFQFPSQWYEFENSRYRDYAPERCHLTSEIIQTLGRGQRNPAIDDLLRQVVILGMPERYSRTSWES